MKRVGYIKLASIICRGRALNALGEVYFDLGEYDKALDLFQQALNLRQSIGDRRGTIRTLNNLGQIYRHIGNPNEAIAYYQQASQEADALGEQTTKVYILNNLGETYAELNQQPEALDSWQEALAIGRNNINVAYAQTLNNLGKYYRQRSQFDLAIDYYEQSLGWARKLDITGLDYQTDWRNIFSTHQFTVANH